MAKNRICNSCTTTLFIGEARGDKSENTGRCCTVPGTAVVTHRPNVYVMYDTADTVVFARIQQNICRLYFVPRMPTVESGR